MFERFTREARETVNAAIEIAEHRGDGRIGTEHLLLGVARSSSLLDAEPLESQIRRLDEEALVAIGIDPDLAGIDPARRRIRRKRHIPFTRCAKNTLKVALSEALEIGDKQIGAEHILLAITRLLEGDRAMRAMMGIGVDPIVLRESLQARRAS